MLNYPSYQTRPSSVQSVTCTSRLARIWCLTCGLSTLIPTSPKFSLTLWARTRAAIARFPVMRATSAQMLMAPDPTLWCSIGVLYFQISQDASDTDLRTIRTNPYISEVWFDLVGSYKSCNNQISDSVSNRLPVAPDPTLWYSIGVLCFQINQHGMYSPADYPHQSQHLRGLV